MIIGLTGSIGSGKSWVTAIIHAHFEVAIIDLDLLGHDILKESTLIQKLCQTFGESILDSTGQINRKNLGSLAFSSPENLAKLNQITHPEIKKTALTLLNKPLQNTMIVGALIQEIGLSPLCDKMIVVTAPDKQLPEEKRPIRSHQRSEEDYLLVADIILKNPFTHEFEHEVLRLFRNLLL